MPWVRFDDQFPIHRKVAGLSDAAFRLHISAICWCARNLTDGHVPVENLVDIAPRSVKRPQKLVESELETRGIWEKNGSGWMVHDYLHFQFSREKIEQDREAKAARQRRWAEKRRRVSNASLDASSDTSLSTGGDASRDVAPTPTLPAPKEGRGGKGTSPPAAGGGGRANPPGSPAPPGWPVWCGQCDNPATRLVEGDDGRVARCSRCHPANTPLPKGDPA